MAENVAIMRARASDDGWDAANWTVFAAALTSPAAIAEARSAELAAAGAGAAAQAGPQLPPGAARVKFYSKIVNGAMVGGDQQGGLHPGAAGVESSSFVWVDAWTLDAHLESIGERHTRVLLLKIDTEGFDAATVRGCEGLLRAGRVGFLVFEFNTKWSISSDKTLAPTIEWLAGVGYECLWITRERLVPLSPPLWWHEYEGAGWSNVLCHKRGDEAARLLRAFYNVAIDPPLCDA
jgi:hypothetical protein